MQKVLSIEKKYENNRIPRPHVPLRDFMLF